MKGISLYSVTPVRADAREGAEQSTQMLFGETYTVLEEQARWTRIRLDSDGQEGWVDAKMCTPMTEEEYQAHREALRHAALVVVPMTYALSENNGQTIPLTAGTWLPNYQFKMTNGESSARFEVLGVGFRIDPSMVISEPLQMSSETFLRTVRFFLNVPYLWGGKNALGMDCSGFTQTVMILFGKHLLRNASEQATQGRQIEDLSKAQMGDLAFFAKSPITSDQSPIISHVGIVIDKERVIHCSGRVKVEKLDATGIFNTEKGEYTHYLTQIRRV